MLVINLVGVFSGPGIKPAQENTIEYLEKVAVEIAQGLANGTIQADRKKRLPRSMQLHDAKMIC